MNAIRFGVTTSSILFAVSMLASGNSLAEWTGGIEGGQVLQGSEQGTKLRFKLSNNDRPFSQSLYADWVRGDSGSSYEAGYTPRYWFSDHIYAFGEGSIRTSKALSIDQQIRALVGAGIQLINTESQSLYAEAGVGQVATTLDDDVFPNAESVTTGLAIARLGATQTLSDLIKLELNADYSTAEDLVTTTAEAGISIRIPGGAIKYSHRIRSSKVDGFDAIDDSDSSISFSYGF